MSAKFAHLVPKVPSPEEQEVTAFNSGEISYDSLSDAAKTLLQEVIEGEAAYAVLPVDQH